MTPQIFASATDFTMPISRADDMGIFNRPQFNYTEHIPSSERSVSPCEVDGTLPSILPTPETDEADLQLASANNPTIVMELDMAGRVRYLSKNWMAIVGTNTKKIVGKPISEFIVGDEPYVFDEAVTKMVGCNASVKVQFVTATNDVESLATSLTDDEDFGEETEPLSPSAVPPQSPTPSTSTVSSKLSNNGDIICLEAQGILIHPLESEPYSMWTIKPQVVLALDVRLPEQLIDLLGAGSEMFAAYLFQLQEMGVVNEEAVPPPQLVLCRICESNIPAWFIERHSDLCVVEHRAADDVQEAHDAVSDHRNTIIVISESLAQGPGPSPLASMESVSSTSSSSSGSSVEFVSDYKGIPLPNIPSAPSTSTSPARALQAHSRQRSRQLIISKKFPFGLLARLVELCDEAIAINPPSSTTDEPSTISLSPPSERHFSAVSQAVPMESSDPAMQAIITDTYFLTGEKVHAISRMASSLEYSERIKRSIDELVLDTVRETVDKIVGQTLANEDELSRKVSHRDSSDASRQGSASKMRSSRQGSLIHHRSRSSSASKSRETITRSNSGSRPPTSLSRKPSDKGRYDPHQSSSLSQSLVKEPRPILITPESPVAPTPLISTPLTPLGFDAPRLPSPPQKLFQEFGYTKSVTPNDILTRSRPSSVNSHSGSSQFSSPRRHLSPANTERNPRPGPPGTALASVPLSGTSTPPHGSPLAFGTRDHLELTPSMPPLPPPATHRTSSSGSGSSVVAAAHIGKATSKPPLSPLLVSTMPQKPQQQQSSIRDYTVIKPISKGAFGSVFLARRKRTGDYVAIKCLKKTDMIAKNQIVNVKSERAVLMNQANSPFVTQLYMTFQSRHYLYLVMEYLPGGDLATLVKNLGTIGDWARQYIAEIVVCVNDLHRRGIIHRDLKPENILIDDHGHAKLTDFGLSRMGVVGRQAGRGASTNVSTPVNLSPMLESTKSLAVDPLNPLPPSRSGPFLAAPASFSSPPTPNLMRTSSETSLSLVEDDFSVSSPMMNPPQQITSFTLYDPLMAAPTRKFVGTPDYLAPETIKGEGQSEASDWWSIGCILFEFLFGYPPFHAETPSLVFQNILAGAIDWPDLPPEEEVKFCPPEAKDLIIQLLKEDPAERIGATSADPIMNHPYFEQIDWDDLYVEDGPFIPQVDDPESTDFFDSRGAEMINFPHDDDHVVDNDDLHLPLMHGNRLRRGSKLAESNEFGSFYFRNLAVLEKANKDAINRLKHEHLEHRSSFSSTGSSTESPSSSTRTRPREYSFGQNSPCGQGTPFKRPISPVPPPSFDDLKDPPQIPPSGFSTLPPPHTYKHERMESIASTYSSGDDFSFDLGHRPSIQSLSLFRDSPPTSDSEETRSSAFFRVQKRRQSNRRAASRAGSFGQGDEVGLGFERIPQFDVLYCEPQAHIRAQVTRLLEKHRCLVVAISDGDELIRRATGPVKFDLILTCLRLGKVGAIDAAKLIRFTQGVNTNTPLVAITTYGDEARASGMFDDVLDKPVDDEKVTSFLTKFVGDDEAIETDGE